MSSTAQHTVSQLHKANVMAVDGSFQEPNPQQATDWPSFPGIFQVSPDSQITTRFCTWASYQIRKIAGCACARKTGKVFLTTHFTGNCLLVSDPGMHHGMCMRHVMWCMSGSLTRVGRESVPGISSACTTRNFHVSGKVPITWRHSCHTVYKNF